MGLRGSMPAAALECKQVFDAGLEKFLARDWNGASALFAQSIKLEWYSVILPGQPTPSQFFLEWCDKLRTNPPGEDWNAVYTRPPK